MDSFFDAAREVFSYTPEENMIKVSSAEEIALNCGITKADQDLKNAPKADAPLEKMLKTDEKVIWRDVPHKAAFMSEAVVKMLPIVLIWNVFDGIFLGAFIFTGALFINPVMLLIIIPFFAVHLMPVWIWIAGIRKSLKKHRVTEYMITDLRVIRRNGPAESDCKDLYFGDADRCRVKRNGIDALVKVGDLIIEGKYPLTVDDIKNPETVSACIDGLIKAAALEKQKRSKEAIKN